VTQIVSWLPLGGTFLFEPLGIANPAAKSQGQTKVVVQVPQVACVQMDGGRIQIRERCGSDEPVEPTENDEPRSGFWRESKNGCLLSMTSQSSDVDPIPTLPAIFTERINLTIQNIIEHSSDA
jgi:hypothetical protein